MGILSSESDSRWPWAVSIPGLTGDGAQFVVEAVTARQPDVQVVTVDPKDFLSLHLDRSTVRDLIEALGSANESPGASGFREILEEWIEFAGDEVDDE